jgi:transketolase-like protein
MPHNFKDAGTGSNCCSGPAPPGGAAGAAQMTISGAKGWTALQSQGFYVPGSGHAAKGLMGAGSLIVFYDQNQISIEDDAGVSFSEGVARAGTPKRGRLLDAITTARHETGRPSMIGLNISGWPTPTKQDTGKAAPRAGGLRQNTVYG